MFIMTLDINEKIIKQKELLIKDFEEIRDIGLVRNIIQVIIKTYNYENAKILMDEGKYRPRPLVFEQFNVRLTFYNPYITKFKETFDDVIILLYQSIKFPWVFYFYVDYGLSTNPSQKRREKVIKIEEDDKELQSIKLFQNWLLFNLLQHIEYPETTNMFFYRQEKLNRVLFARLLYHALNHPEQYVSDNLNDEIDKLMTN